MRSSWYRRFISSLYFSLSLIPVSINAQGVVNIYAWGGEVPLSVIKKFEDQTDIKVNFSTFDSNESLYAKLRTSDDYDIIMPSSYFVDKLRKEKRLLPLDKSKIPNIKYLNPEFLNPSYDPNSTYSLPYNWGITGIFYNKNIYKNPPMDWQSLWGSSNKNKLLLLDDAREVFSMALLALGYSPNDTNPEHIKEAYQKLLALRPNIKTFSTNTLQGMIVDEDATIGMAWNSDILKSQYDGANVEFIYPKEGFVIWVDCFSILKNAPHKEEAYQLLNFLFDPLNVKAAIIEESIISPSTKAYQLLPAHIRNNPLISPPKEVLKRGINQKDIGTKATKLLIQYWQQLKLSF